MYCKMPGCIIVRTRFLNLSYKTLLSKFKLQNHLKAFCKAIAKPIGTWVHALSMLGEKETLGNT